MELQDLLNMKDTSLIDVRSVEEFNDGTIEGALNIPLHTIPVRLEEFKSLPQPVIVFCRSGARSHQATMWLKQNGVEVYDGGGIANVAALKR